MPSLSATLVDEIARVKAKAERWLGRAINAPPKMRGAFARPSRAMLDDCARAQSALDARDPKAIAESLQALRAYHDED